MIYHLILANQIGPNKCINRYMCVCVRVFILYFVLVLRAARWGMPAGESIDSICAVSQPENMPLTKPGEPVCRVCDPKKSLK